MFNSHGRRIRCPHFVPEVRIAIHFPCILNAMMPKLRTDDDFMRQALHLAMRGRGTVEPNPMVGCVIVKEGRVIGQGWHEKYGGPHAEPNALANCAESPAGATVYETLEPCCHEHKQTPPCVPRLIEAKVARVVIGCVDPNPQVAGRGIEQLRQAGIAVDVGIFEAECKQLASLFFARIGLQRPYVTLKWAQTADGKVAGPGGTRLQISNAASTLAVHRLRAACDSILVGVRTVLADDPLLTARLVDAVRQPARYVLDRELVIPPDAKVLTDMTALTTVFCAFNREAVYRQKRDAILAHKAGVNNVRVGGNGKLDLAEALEKIADDCHRDLLVEAGPSLAQGFFEAGLVDRVWVIRSSRSEPDTTAPAAAAIPAGYVATGKVDLAGDTLTEYLNPGSPVFFSGTPSADLLYASPLPAAPGRGNRIIPTLQSPDPSPSY